MPEPLIHVFRSLEDLSEAACRRTAELIKELPDEPFAIVLSGGSTPVTFHRYLAGAFRDAIPWPRIHLFWGDERFVPHDDPDSNYLMARKTFISDIPIPEANVHPIQTEGLSPEDSARRYEEEIRAFLDANGKAGLDLVVLGMGDDGHTASLFPNTPILTEQERWAAPMEAPDYATVKQRITLTLPLLNRSRHVFFLAAGAKKAGPLGHIRRSPDIACPEAPAACVRAMVTLEWFVDEAAYGEG